MNTINENIGHNVIKKKDSLIYFLWILPIAALLISSWMIFKHLNEQAEEIIIYFDSADGLVVDKTQLKYKGIKVGVISDIDINKENINEFIITIKVNKRIKKIIATEGTKFWKVEPKASLTEISGLNTILGGVYINLSLSSNNIDEINQNKSKTTFRAIQQEPVNVLDTSKGIYLNLSSEKGSLSVGTPVLYKNFNVGKVLKKVLKNNKIIYTIIIDNQYKQLVKEDSVFWNIKAFELKASLSGISVNVESLATLIAGGITFSSNDNSKILGNNSKKYKLYNTKEDIEFSDKPITLTLKSNRTLSRKLTQVIHNGIVVGKILKTQFLAKENLVQVTILLKKDYINLLEYDPYFHIVKPSISLDNLEELTNILKTDYINLVKTTSKISVSTNNYVLHSKAKKINMYSISLKTNDSLKIGEGAPVYFKDIKIGEVSYKRLEKKSDTVRIGLDISWRYRYLINDTTLFYLESPIEINANLSEISIKSAPIKSYVKSAISFDTFNLKSKSTTKRFKLFSSYKDMKDQQYLQKKGRTFKIEVDALTSLNKNDFIYYKGVEAGKIIGEQYNSNSKKVDIELFIFEKFAKLVNLSTRFYSIGGIDINFSLDKVNLKTKSLDTLIKGATSFITLDNKAKKYHAGHRFKYYNTLDEAEDKYVTATIYMDRGYDLKKGSKILYKDIEIGKIKSLIFSENKKIKATVDILKKHKLLLNKDTIFYLNNFEFSISKIKNPSAAIFGPNISVIEGSSNIQNDNFILMTSVPMERLNKNGIRLIVNSETKSSLKKNSPIYYRQVQIGVVESYLLSDNSSKVKIQLFIKDEYKYLVRENTIFYMAGAFGVDINLFGAKIKTETLETLISGGISMVNPTNYGPRIKEMHEFELKAELDEKWLGWNPIINKYE